jgi:hypothetical protein
MTGQILDPFSECLFGMMTVSMNICRRGILPGAVLLVLKVRVEDEK